ncbi:MAG: hypothetical protein LBI61_02515 [Puniceicoccales bacterium]|jgi:hypothetical protein|nr:hypothetical protein [Puniceicoccales bacterium]
MSTDRADDRGNWCVIYLGDDYNWWVHDASDSVSSDVESQGIIDPKQVEHMADLLSQLRQYGLNDEIVSCAFAIYAIEREVTKEMLRVRETKDNIFDPRDAIFCLPNVAGEQDGPFMDFLDHVVALRVKLLNATLDFKQPLSAEEVEDVLHAERQERYISGERMHAFDEIMAILDYVPVGYSIDGDIDGIQVQEEILPLAGFDAEIDESLDMPDEKNW